MIRIFRKITWYILILISLGYAGQLTRAEVEKAAVNYLRHSPYFRTSGISYIPTRMLIPITEGRNPRPVAYVMPLSPTGFVVLSSNSQIKPIICYSDESPFSAEDAEQNILLQMIRKDMALRKNALRHRQTPDKLIDKYQRFWNALWGKTALSPADSIELYGGENIVGPFLDSFSQPAGNARAVSDSIYFFPTPTWGQGYVNGYLVFNLYTPNHWPAGCVATAMAQILTYYRWPPRGTGSHSYYEDDAGWLSANYGQTVYDWANTLDVYLNVFTNQQQRAAAGLLTYHCCVSVNMDFEENGSTASTSDAPYALHSYFRHSGHYMSAGSTFFSQLQNNMEDARPAALAISSLSGGPGHAVVADGFASGNGYFHLNMGWNGINNNWYDITGAFYATGYGNAVVDGGVKGIVPNPVICDTVQMLTTHSFILSWNISHRLNAERFELQQKKSGQSWVTLSDAIPDTFTTITVSNLGTYYYRVRARRDNIWWDWSETQEITLGTERYVTFNVNMTYRPLQPGETLLLLGNIPPLGGVQNSPPFTGPDSNGVYSTTVAFDYDHVGDTLLYRYAVLTANGVEMEDSNRVYVITPSEFQNIPPVYFNVFTGIRPGRKEHLLTQTAILFPNYPNPFNSSTVVEYLLPRRQTVSLKLYNLLGQEIRTLLNRQIQPAGIHRHRLDFGNLSLPAGVYFIRFRTGQVDRVQKMLYLK